MYTPAYLLSDRLINNIVRLENAKTFISSQIEELTSKDKLARRSKSLNIFHAAHMLGLTMSIKDAEKLVDGKRFPLEDTRVLLLNNFRNVLEFNRSSVAEGYADVDKNLLVHINKILLTDWKETWDAKVRESGEHPDSSMDSWMELRDSNIDPAYVQHELFEILEWFKVNRSGIYPMIRLSALLYRLLEIAPMLYLNKLTIIGVADFLLHKYGFANAYLPIARTFDVYADDYFEAWATSKERGEIGVWIERLIRNLATDMSETRDEFFRLKGEQQQTQKQPFLDLNKRQLKILKYLQTIPTVKREDYCQMMDVSTMTAFRDLSDLVDKKLLRIEGRGRGTKYMLYSR